MINTNIFREYDIRGHAERDLGPAVVERLGQALAAFYRKREKRSIGVGRDCRLSSPRIFEVLSAQLTAGGIEVVDLGVIPTPLAYFSVHQHHLEGVIQITGSHNPPEDNGLKLMCGKDTLFGDDIKEIRALALEPPIYAGPTYPARTLELLASYVDYIKSNVRPIAANIRIAIDAGSGAMGPTAVAVMRALGIDAIELLCEMDGHFPVHHPDPTQPENLELLRKTVSEHQCALGIAFDGDGDRLGVIDHKGDILWGDKLMILFARDVLAQKPGAAIIGEVKCSQTLYDDIAKHGGRPIIWKTGHSLIKKKMKEEHAALAGEMSGHIFFADRYFGYDDALYAALRLLEIVSQSGTDLVTLLADVPVTYATAELRVDCKEQDKFPLVSAVAEHFRKTHEVLEIDGARIKFKDGWGLVRASNTQAVLVTRFEATSPQARDAIQTEVGAVLSAAQAKLKTHT